VVLSGAPTEHPARSARRSVIAGLKDIIARVKKKGIKIIGVRSFRDSTSGNPDNGGRRRQDTIRNEVKTRIRKQAGFDAWKTRKLGATREIRTSFKRGLRLQRRGCIPRRPAISCARRSISDVQRKKIAGGAQECTGRAQTGLRFDQPPALDGLTEAHRRADARNVAVLVAPTAPASHAGPLVLATRRGRGQEDS